MKKLIRLYIDQYRYLPLPVWLVFFAEFVNSGIIAVTLFFSIYFSTVLNFSTTAIGWLMTAAGGGAVVGSLMGGILCDRFSARLVITVALIVNAIILSAMSFLTQYNLLVLAMALLSTSVAACFPANRIAILRFTPYSDHKRVNALQHTVRNVGIGAFIFIGGRLAAFGYDKLFLLISLSVIIIAIISLYAYLRIPMEPIEEAAVDQAKTYNNKYFLNFILTYAGLFLIWLVFTQLRTTYPLYLHYFYQLDDKQFSNLFLINSIIVILFQVTILNFLKNFNSILMAGIGAAFIGIGMGLLPFGASFSFALLLCLLWTFGEIIYFSTLQIVIYAWADPTQKGKHMGIYQMMTGFGSIVGPIGGATLYTVSNARWLWLTCILLGIITFLFHLTIFFTSGETT